MQRSRLNSNEETISFKHKDSIQMILHSDLSHPDFQHRNPVVTIRNISLVLLSRSSTWETGPTQSSPSSGRNYPLLPDREVYCLLSTNSLFSLQILSSSHSNKCKYLSYLVCSYILCLWFKPRLSIMNSEHTHHPPPSSHLIWIGEVPARGW